MTIIQLERAKLAKRQELYNALPDPVTVKQAAEFEIAFCKALIKLNKQFIVELPAEIV